MTSAIDLAATICELAGTDSPRQQRFQGASMKSVLRDPKAVHRDVVFTVRNWHISSAHERHGARGSVGLSLERLAGEPRDRSRVRRALSRRAFAETGGEFRRGKSAPALPV